MTAVASQLAEIGVIGLAVMGENLALNIEDHGYPVALWTRTEGKVHAFIERNRATRQWVGTRTLEEFTAALVPPRRILLMVKAGEPVDEMLAQLTPLLSRGDVVIDGGNSFFRDRVSSFSWKASCRDMGWSFGRSICTTVTRLTRGR